MYLISFGLNIRLIVWEGFLTLKTYDSNKISLLEAQVLRYKGTIKWTLLEDDQY